MKKHILVVSQYFYPEQFRINELCYELAKQYDVTVLTGYPNYPEGVIYPAYQDKKIKNEIINNVKVIRVNIVPRKKGAVHLFINYLSYAFWGTLEIFKNKQKFDAIFVFEVSPITQIIPAWMCKIKTKAPLIVNCQDIWPDAIKVYGIKEKSFLFKCVKKFSSFLYNKADTIVTSSPGFNEYLKNMCGVPKNKMCYVPNFAEDFYLDFGNQINEDKKLHLLFAGNIGKAQNLDIIVQTLKLLEERHRDKIVFDILGTGSYLRTLQDLIRKNNFEKYFVFHGRKPLEDIKEYYEKADAFLIMLEGASPVSLTIPSKLQGYMGAGKPILGAINGGANEIIKDSQCGLCVNADDVEGFTDILRQFIETQDHFKELGENGRKYFKKKFSLEIYVKEIKKIVEGKNDNI